MPPPGSGVSPASEGGMGRVRLRTEGRGQPEGLPQTRSPKPALRRIWAEQSPEGQGDRYGGPPILWP